MPGILADKDCGTPPRGVEGADLVTALHETLLVEQPVSRKEGLAMDVQDARCPLAEPHVRCGIVERAAPSFVEPGNHVHRPQCAGHRAPIGTVEVGRQSPRAHGHLAHATLHEVSREHGLG